MPLAALIFALGITILDLFTGFATIGWSGGNMVVERAKSPGPYWFTIVLGKARECWPPRQGRPACPAGLGGCRMSF